MYEYSNSALYSWSTSDGMKLSILATRAEQIDAQEVDVCNCLKVNWVSNTAPPNTVELLLRFPPPPVWHLHPSLLDPIFVCTN